jgi:hypothetical protein
LKETGLLSAERPARIGEKGARRDLSDFSNALHDKPSAPLGAERGGSLHEIDCPTEIPA